MRPKDQKIIDRIFTELAVEGVGDLSRLDITRNDGDFCYVLNRFCEKKNILVGTLFTRDELMRMAEGGCVPHLPCMLYFERPDMEHDLAHLRFYAPELAVGTASAALGRLKAMLADSFEAQCDPVLPVARDPLESRFSRQELPVIKGEGAGVLLEHITTRQPYFYMDLPGDEMDKLREQLQNELQKTLASLNTEMPVLREAYAVHTLGGKVLNPSLRVKLLSDSPGRVRIQMIAEDRQNEAQCLRFRELSREILQWLDSHDADARAHADGVSFMVEGKDAHTLVMRALSGVQERELPVSKPTGWWIARTPVPSSPPAKRSQPGTLDYLLENVAYKAIRIQQTERLTREGLDQQGRDMQRDIAALMKDYLATRGIDTQEKLVAAEPHAHVTEHHGALSHYFTTLTEPPAGVSWSLLQQALVILVQDAHKLGKGIQPEGFSGDCGTPGG